MALPVTARYVVRFRHSDTGLTPVFRYFKRLDTLVEVAQPAVLELGGGAYYFDYPWALEADPDIAFELDGGASIPTEEVRYVADVISVRDFIVSASGGGGGTGGPPAWTVGR